MPQSEPGLEEFRKDLMQAGQML